MVAPSARSGIPSSTQRTPSVTANSAASRYRSGCQYDVELRRITTKELHTEFDRFAAPTRPRHSATSTTIASAVVSIV